VWSHLIVVYAPSLAFSDRVVEAHEPVLVQAFRLEFAVERFNEGVVGRLAGAAEVEDHAMCVGPQVEILARLSHTSGLCRQTQKVTAGINPRPFLNSDSCAKTTADLCLKLN
jgi:hypothetical protein